MNSSDSSWWGLLTGQCAPVDELASMACSQNDDSQQFRASDSFLAPHRADRPMGCIIETNQVLKAIQHQGDEMMRRDYRKRIDETEESLRKESARQEICQDRAASMWDDDVMSAFGDIAPSVAMTEARTDITSGTEATRFAANLDRYSRARPKYNSIPRPPSFTVLGAIQPYPSSNDSADVMGMKHRFASVSASNERIDDDLRALKQGTPLLHPDQSGCSGIVAPCRGEPVGIVIKEEYYHALHLQLHFHCIDFYRNCFLPMFPKSPIPRGLSLSQKSLDHSPCRPFRERPPQMVRSGSWSSASTNSPSRGVVDFGTSGIRSWPVKFLVDESSFMDLAMTGSLGLVDRGVALTPSTTRKPPEHYLVLMNRRSGVPLAVCALKSKYGEPVVRIYATKQRVIGQHPATSTGSLGLDWSDSYPLFAWAEFNAEGEFPLPVRYSVYMSSGSAGRFEKEASYRAYHKTVGSPDIMVVGRTETEDQFKGCATLSLKRDEADHSLHFACLSLSHGIDPALLICFAAIVDETMERTMRLQCDVSRQRRIKKCGTPRREQGNQ
jgi:hypothetical protein